MNQGPYTSQPAQVGNMVQPYDPTYPYSDEQPERPVSPYPDGWSGGPVPPPVPAVPYVTAQPGPLAPAPAGLYVVRAARPAGPPVTRAVGSKATVAVLALTLGVFGAHSFYQGQTGRGAGHLGLVAVAALGIVAAYAVMLLMSPERTAAPLGGLLVILSLLALVVDAVWAFVEFVLALSSTDGRLS